MSAVNVRRGMAVTEEAIMYSGQMDLPLGLVGGEEVFEGEIKDFNPRILPTPLSGLVHDVACASHMPKGASLACLLGLGSACLNGAVEVEYKRDWYERANLFIMVLADSGSGKTPLLNDYTRALYERHSDVRIKFEEERAAYDAKMLIYKRELRQWENATVGRTGTRRGPGRPKKANNATIDDLDCAQGLNMNASISDIPSSDANEPPVPPVPPVCKHYIVNDATWEAVMETLKYNPRGLACVADEFYGWLGRFERYGNSGRDTIRGQMLSAWSGNPIDVMRKSKDGVQQSFHIKHGYLSILAMCQCKLFRKLFNLNDIAGGFPQRFLYVHAASNAIRHHGDENQGVSLENATLIGKITDKLLNVRPMDDNTPCRVYFSLTARQLLYSYINKLGYALSTSSVYKEFVGKLISNFLRVCLILHCLVWAANDPELTKDEKEKGSFPPPEIDENIVLIAVNVFDFLLKHVFKTIRILQDEKLIERPAPEANVRDEKLNLCSVLLKHKKSIAANNFNLSIKDLKLYYTQMGFKYTSKVADILRIDFNAKDNRNSKCRYLTIPSDIFTHIEGLMKRTDIMDEAVNSDDDE